MSISGEMDGISDTDRTTDFPNSTEKVNASLDADSPKRYVGAWRARLRNLTGRGRADLPAHVIRQIDATLDAATLVQSVVESTMMLDSATEAMRSVEHAGDEARAELIVALSSAFNTPIDREDLFRLSRSTDDVLDNLRDFLREVRLFLPADLVPCRPLLAPVSEGLRHLREGVSSIAGKGTIVDLSTLATRKAGTAIRRGYEERLADLFAQPISAETLKQRELLRRLDIVGLRLCEAADALADGWLKRGR